MSFIKIYIYNFSKINKWVINMQQNGTKRELFIGATVQPIQNC